MEIDVQKCVSTMLAAGMFASVLPSLIQIYVTGMKPEFELGAAHFTNCIKLFYNWVDS